MNIIAQIIAYIISLPARIKGMKFGHGSFIGPGYDFMFARLQGIVLGNNVLIGKNAWLQTSDLNKKNPIIKIGDRTHLGRGAVISALDEISIGTDCLISYNVSILDHDHDFSDLKATPVNSGLSKPQKIIIEDACFIGAHSFILKGVRLGRHCIVGANSVVNKSFPAYSVIAGNPAKLIKKLK